MSAWRMVQDSNLRELGIRVNAVSPGVIKMPMHSAETHAQHAKMHPLGPIGEVSEIVGAILYLASLRVLRARTLEPAWARKRAESARKRSSVEGVWCTTSVGLTGMDEPVNQIGAAGASDRTRGTPVI
jgi:NAD(P)-dependent dehydrogenase (short-subunit alcohol dehydrogenase family)